MSKLRQVSLESGPPDPLKNEAYEEIFADVNVRAPKYLLLGLCTFLALLAPGISQAETASSQPELRIGWVGALTGRAAKYGAWEAARLAADDVNAAGGVRGKKLMLVGEDGRCEAPVAISAMQKLIQIDHVNFVLGGHCSSETLAIAPLAERNKVLMLASITTSSDVTKAGDFVFRISPSNLEGARIISEYMYRAAGVRELAVLSEETEYALSIARGMEKNFRSLGGEVILFDNFDSKDTDFRSMLARVKSKNPGGLYLATQSQDSALMLLRQIKEMGLKLPTFGNETVGQSAAIDQSATALSEGVVYAEPEWSPDKPEVKDFTRRFCERYKVAGLPYGIWTSEAYDSVRLMAKVINECGEDVEAVKQCLYKVKDYPGISGNFSINEFGDGVKKYVVKRVENGREVKIQ